jgi:hypothetical protein
MATTAETAALLAAVRDLRLQVTALDDPGTPGMLLTLKQLKAQADAADARASSEAERQEKSIGAAPRFRRSY